MSTELCPRCKSVRHIVHSSKTEKRHEPDGTEKTVRIDVYHCGTCNGFVRSEEVLVS